MAALTIVYDRLEPPLQFANFPVDDVKIARRPVPDDLTEVDLYEVARRLAELLLEQLAR